MDQFISENANRLLDEQINSPIIGDTLYQEAGQQLLPIKNCERSEINQNSIKLVEKAVKAYANERQLFQV